MDTLHIHSILAHLTQLLEADYVRVVQPIKYEYTQKQTAHSTQYTVHRHKDTTGNAQQSFAWHWYVPVDTSACILSSYIFIIESIRLHVFTFYTRSLHEIQCSFARVGCWYVVVFCVMVLVFYLLLVVRSFSCFECCCLLVVASVLSFECVCTCGL